MSEDFTFERDTVNDPFFNSDMGRFVIRAISNDFTVKYYIVDEDIDRCKFPINQVSLGLYNPRDEYKITYSKNKDKIQIRTYQFKCIDYLYIENSSDNFIIEMNESKCSWCNNPYISKDFFERYNIPEYENQEFNIIWKTEVYENGELSKIYKQKIRCVPMIMKENVRAFLDL
jgi:hypothetical protein